MDVRTIKALDESTWDDFAAMVEPLAARTLWVEDELTEAGAYHYRLAARWLKKMRQLATGTDKAAEVDGFIAELARATAVGRGSSRSSTAPAPLDRVRSAGLTSYGGSRVSKAHAV